LGNSLRNSKKRINPEIREEFTKATENLEVKIKQAHKEDPMASAIIYTNIKKGYIFLPRC